MIPDDLRALIERERPKFLYTIPNFQNPTGVTLTAERRKKLYSIAAHYDRMILEDDPYGFSRAMRESRFRPSRHSIAKASSSISAPSQRPLRRGCASAGRSPPSRFAPSLTIAKQAADLHTSSLDQRIVHRYLTGFDSEAHIERIRRSYGERFAIMDGLCARPCRRDLPGRIPRAECFSGHLSRGREHE